MTGRHHSEESRAKIAEKASLRIGVMSSNFKHGDSGSNLYQHWQSMKVRCWRDYVGKGRQVCDEWKNFKNFKIWALTHGFKENLSLDRIDNKLGYFPDNCQWIPFSENVSKDNKKTTEDQRTQIRKLREQDWNIKDIALKFSVSRSCIENIIYKKQNHVSQEVDVLRG